MTNTVPRRRLGKTELQVPALSLGGATLGGVYGQVGDAEAIATVETALQQGINYIDTSPLYGESERRIGIALKGVARGDYVLSTKTGTHPTRRGDFSWDGTMWSVDNSLRLLGVDYLDIVLVHDPDDIAPVFATRGALETLEHLKAQGVIGAIGLGQRKHEWHRMAIESGRFDVILTFNDYHPIRTTALTDGLLQLAKTHDVGVINGSPLAHGLLVGNDPRDLPAEVQPQHGERERHAAAQLYDFAQKHGVPVVAVALQYCLRQPLISCTLSGAGTAAELNQNLRAVSTPLPDSLWAELEALQLTAGQV